jgi:hypothetical protein
MHYAVCTVTTGLNTTLNCEPGFLSCRIRKLGTCPQRFGGHVLFTFVLNCWEVSYTWSLFPTV